MDKLPDLPCPECKLRGRGGNARIGNRRNGCTTCNNFAQNVMRLTRSRLKELHAEEYEKIRLQVEMDLYPQVIEDHALRFKKRDIELDEFGFEVKS